jgi:hypothetical protein
MEEEDRIIVCIDCHQPFTFAAGEQLFFSARDFPPPTRCRPCRAFRKREKADRGRCSATARGGETEALSSRQR